MDIRRHSAWFYCTEIILFPLVVVGLGLRACPQGKAEEARRGPPPLFESLRRELGPLAGLSGQEVKAGPESITIGGGGLAVRVRLEDASWDVVWAGGAEVGIAGVRFGASADGKEVTSSRPEITSRRVAGPTGEIVELTCGWESGGVRVERDLRVDPRRGVVILGGRITNQTDHPVKLGTVKLLDVGSNGGWWAGGPGTAPASVYIQGHSLLRSTPSDVPGRLDQPRARSYRSSGVLALVGRDPGATLLVGYLRADEAAPDVAADFRRDEGGVSLSAHSRFFDRLLRPKATLELNRVYLAADHDPFHALEAYGDALADASDRPARRGATSLWCSWYAHRMAMTEEKVLANAAVAARHFQPLGLTIMQLDHGWQRGDITGDWVPNERFPHGLKWLANELRERHGLRLGVWIAPTDVAETSDLFRNHRDWMLKGPDGAPRVNWRWYWAPNPNCYELDATHPDAFNFIVETFRRLSSEGVSYYKIDFIAGAGAEHFIQHDPEATRGWSNLRRAMEAIRTGAGETAWIRYCQTPPILSVGLADSAYGGDDTLDAGIPGRFDVLRDNAHALAAGYWLNDRPYHREVCDMSVRMQAGIEEARVRAAIMTLANCSISWSDELCYLPPSRIRLMQQCLPPGNPPMRPLDLFERDVPSIWHIRATNSTEAWDVVGLFNFNTNAETRNVRFESLPLDPTAQYAVFEFWEQRFVGLCRGGVELTLPPESSRILSIRRVSGVPQLVGTDLHLLQGVHEVKHCAWDANRATWSAVYQRAPGLQGKIYLLVPEGYSPKFDFPLSPASARLTHVEGPLWMQEIEFETRECSASIPFNVAR